MNELMPTATQLVGGPPVTELEAEQVADLTRAAAQRAAWRRRGKTPASRAKDLAEQLFATSYGVKHRVSTAADYRERMRIAVQLVCASRPSR